MAEDNINDNGTEPEPATQHAQPSNSSPNEVSTPQESATNVPLPAAQIDRAELLARARTFLTSPQILDQELSAKRRFLVDKGLNEAEIEGLLRELPLQRPTIPPRTYPQPPPSNLPNLLVGLARLFSWVAGGSAVMIFIYYRFLLPRITNTSNARHSIRAHHLSLMRRLTTSIDSLKESQSESYSALPRPEPYQEPKEFADCSSVDSILAKVEDRTTDIKGISPITLIRCGITDFGRGKEAELACPITEELFQYLESQIPWLVSEDGLKYEQTLWETLSTCPLFKGTPSLPTPSAVDDGLEDQRPTRWTYIPPKPQEPSPVLKSLETLSSSVPKTERSSPYQHTLQTLTDFTGYLSTQIYLPYRPQSTIMGFSGAGNTLSPPQEEFRREIRALKGLVLNRRSFMPTIPRPSVLSSPSSIQ